MLTRSIGDVYMRRARVARRNYTRLPRYEKKWAVRSSSGRRRGGRRVCVALIRELHTVVEHRWTDNRIWMRACAFYGLRRTQRLLCHRAFAAPVLIEKEQSYVFVLATALQSARRSLKDVLVWSISREPNHWILPREREKERKITTATCHRSRYVRIAYC